MTDTNTISAIITKALLENHIKQTTLTEEINRALAPRPGYTPAFISHMAVGIREPDPYRMELLAYNSRGWLRQMALDLLAATHPDVAIVVSNNLATLDSIVSD